jgi:hypothetical protein
MDRVIILVIMMAGLSACSTLDRSTNSGYGYSDAESSMKSVDDFYAARAREKSKQARTELGYEQAQTLSEGEVAAVRARIELNRLEKNLEYDDEKKQYFSFKPFFKNDYERIQFLQLPTREARQRWAQTRGLKTEETEFDTSTQQLIENNDIARGMSRNAVIQSWGNPDIEEHAGNPVYGNERWVYNKQVSTDQGYKQERRLIYFEAGRVVGWETE